MSRDPYAGGYYNEGGGGYDDGSDDDSGGSDGVREDLVDDTLDGGGSSGSGPGGSSPPAEDVGGADDDPAVREDLVDDTLDGGGSSGSGPGGSSPPAEDVGGVETVSGSTTIAADATPGPRAPVQPGGDSGIIDSIAQAEATPEIVERATTGGLLSERGESAGLLPSEVGGVDVSETRLRETARAASSFGDSVDLSAAFSSPADPLSAGGDVSQGRPIGAPDPESENPAEEFVEGGAGAFTDLPAGLVQAETGAEIAQSSPGVAQDFSAGEIGETTTAVGRDIAAQTAAEAQQNPAEFAGGVAAGAALGAGALSRGPTGGLRAAVRAEVDPRVGPFGTTAETRVTRAARDFLDDDRGQLQMGRQRSPDADGDADTVADDSDLGPDIDPFDRSDRRLYDPSREFDDDVGGMADAPDPVDPAEARSREDIGAGVSGRGDPQMAPGVDADSFSERGFGDVTGTSLDPNPTDTLGDAGGLSVGDSGVGGLFGVGGGAAAGGVATGLLGAPADLDATGATPDVGGRTRTVTSPFYDDGLFDAPDTGTDTPGDTRADTPTDTRTDSPTDIDQPDPLDIGTDIDARGETDTDTPDLGDPELRDPREPRDPRDPSGLRDPRDVDAPFEPESESDDEAVLFGTRAEDRQFGSGILSGEAAISEFLGR